MLLGSDFCGLFADKWNLKHQGFAHSGTCWVGAIREKSCSSYFESCFFFPHILGVNPKFVPNSLNCLPYTAWRRARKKMTV